MSMSYATFVGDKDVAGSISRMVAYDDIDREAILEDAQALIYSTLRAREMKATYSMAMAIGEYQKALPSGYIGPIGKYIRDTNNQKYRHTIPDRIAEARLYDDDGNVYAASRPMLWSVFDEMIQFEQGFSEARTLKLLYFKSGTLLSSTNQTNFLTSRYPNILRKACRVEAMGYLEYWDARATELDLLVKLIQRANVETDMELDGADFDTGIDSNYDEDYI